MLSRMVIVFGLLCAAVAGALGSLWPAPEVVRVTVRSSAAPVPAALFSGADAEPQPIPACGGETLKARSPGRLPTDT